MFRSDHPLAGRSVTISELAAYPLVLWPRTVSRGAHDTVLGMFAEHQPAATRIADVPSGVSWDAMQAAVMALPIAEAEGAVKIEDVLRRAREIHRQHGGVFGYDFEDWV